MGDVQCGVDAVVLGRLGHGWAGTGASRADGGRVDVALPADLAAAAVEAWERDDPSGGAGGEESPGRHRARHHAAALARIGRAVAERGRPDGDTVHVDLEADLVALAVRASDDLPG